MLTSVVISMRSGPVCVWALLVGSLVDAKRAEPNEEVDGLPKTEFVGWPKENDSVD